jgi:phage baseplate assembly protein W
VTPRNLFVPFQRDQKRDFATATGADLLGSKVRQVLLTDGVTPWSGGELPWRTTFGAALGRLRHLPADAARAELARVYVRDALRRWMPEVELRRVTVESLGPALVVSVWVRADGLSDSAVQVELD